MKSTAKMRLLRAILASLTCAGGIACGDAAPPTGDESAVLTISLQGAAADDRGLLLDIGTGARSVEAAGTAVSVFARRTGSRYTVAVIGPLAGQSLLRVEVASAGSVPTFTVRQVAAADGVLRSDLTTYSIRVGG